MGARGHPVHLSRVGGSEFIVGIGTRRDTTDGRDLLLLSPPAATGGNCQSDSHESESHLRPVVRSLLCHCVMTLPGHVYPPLLTLCHCQLLEGKNQESVRLPWPISVLQTLEDRDEFKQFGFASSFRSEVTYTSSILTTPQGL